MLSNAITKRDRRKPLDGCEDRIKQLYRDLSLKQLKAIIDEELDQNIPESQYRQKFNQLGLGKYRKTSETDILSSIFAQMPKGSRVFWRGEQISQSEVKRIISRGRPDIFVRLGSHQLPKNYVIRAPSPDRPEDYTANIPFLEFEHALRMCFEDPSTQRLLESTGVSPQSLRIEENTPAGGAEYVAGGWDLISLNMNNTQALGDAFFSNNMRALSNLAIVMPFSDVHNHISDGSPTNADLKIANDFLRRQLLFSIANGFAGIDGFPIWQPFKLLQGVSVQLLNQLFRFIPGPTLRAIAQSLFKASIESNSYTIIDAILSNKLAHIDVNKEKIYVDGYPFTPVERASILLHHETIVVLIRHGADTSKAYNSVFRLERVILYLNRKPKHEVFALLINEAFIISYETIKQLIHMRRESVFLYIIKHHLKQCDFLSHIDDALSRMFLIFSEQAVLDTLSILGYLKVSRGFLNRAARKGWGELYWKLISDYGLCPDRYTLKAIIQGENVSLFEAIRRGESRVISQVCPYSCGTTLQSVAIRQGNDEGIGLSICGGTFNHFHSWKTFKKIYDAAEETKNQAVLDKMIQICSEIGEKQFGEDQNWGLWVACRTGNYQRAKELVDQGAEGSHDLLKAAIQDNDIRLFYLLMDSMSWFDSTLITCAVKCSNFSAVRALLAEGASPEIEALHDAMRRKDEEMVNLLLDAGVDTAGDDEYITNPKRSPLQVAAEVGDEQWTRYMLSRGADPYDIKALEIAYQTSQKCFEIILTAYKERYNRRMRLFGRKILLSGIESGNLSLVQMLLEHNADPHCFSDKKADWVSPFGYAIINANGSNLPMVTAFLNHHCHPSDRVTCVAIDGRRIGLAIEVTAFLAAIATENTKLVHLLAEKDETIIYAPARRSIKRTALQRAAEVGSLKMVKLLHNLGAQINEPPNRDGGATSLQLAAIGGFGQIVCYLIDHGADVNAPAALRNGMTALVGAASRGRIDIVAILLNKGAGSGEDGNAQFERAMAEAEEYGHYPTYDYLKERREAQPREDFAQQPDPVEEFMNFCDED
ncbi:ankyrin [Xylaria arbuscula]|nr:ankyrin [Xylaria arbuscula]